jgi:spore germination cell wall hydrolase CwlJ-like protein
LERLLINARFFWREIGSVNQVLIVAGAVFTASTSATLYKVFNDKYQLREIRCLAMNIYHEARGEPQAGKYAVAKVTMNRVDSPRYPGDVCRVVHQRVWDRKRRRYLPQFSWTADELDDIPQESQAWLDSVEIAREVYTSPIETKVDEALFYHADYVQPRWARQKVRIAKIGRHIFYK